MADQTVVPFQPQYSAAPQTPAPQQQYTPPMQASPQTAASSYVPPQQSYMPQQQAPMGSGLGSYFQQMSAQNAAPRPSYSTASTGAPSMGAYSYNPATKAYTQNQPTAAAAAASAANAWSHPVIGYDYESDSPQYGPWTNNATGAKQWYDPNADPHSFEHHTYDDNGNKAGGSIRSSYASGGSVSPQGLASLGRGQDSMLVHMTPGEVQGLQKLAMSQGGSLTINPHTGLAEAGFLSSMLPTIIGLGITAASGGTIPGWMIGAGVGGATALSTGSLSKGLMAGLGAYGGSGLASGLGSMGTQQATDAINAEAAQSGAAAARSATQGLQGANAFNIENLVNQSALNPDAAMSPDAYREFLTNQASSTVQGYIPQDQIASMAQNAGRDATTAFGNASTMPSQSQATLNGLKSMGSGDVGTNLQNLYKAMPTGSVSALAGAGLGAISANQKQPSVNAPPAGTNSRYVTKFDPKTGQYYGSYIDTYNKNDPNSFNVGMPASYSSPTPPVPSSPYPARNAAQGGLLDSMEQNSYPQARLPLQHMSRGGLEDTQEYAAGGKLLRGPGDGMSDSIPAVIKGAKPQRAALADGEFVIPADVVSHLGNGSTEAGAKRLYSMMDKVRHARTGNPKQGKQINPDKFMPA